MPEEPVAGLVAVPGAGSGTAATTGAGVVSSTTETSPEEAVSVVSSSAACGVLCAALCEALFWDAGWAPQEARIATSNATKNTCLKKYAPQKGYNCRISVYHQARKTTVKGAQGHTARNRRFWTTASK
jgi:hypothetical protein